MLATLESIKNYVARNQKIDEELMEVKSDIIRSNLKAVKEDNLKSIQRLKEEVTPFLNALKDTNETTTLTYIYARYFNADQITGANVKTGADCSYTAFRKRVHDLTDRWDKKRKL